MIDDYTVIGNHTNVYIGNKFYLDYIQYLMIKEKEMEHDINMTNKIQNVI